jgi:large subunit ribosomal protein L6
MSRVSSAPVLVPKEVQLKFSDGLLFVKGPLGELSLSLSPLVKVTQSHDSLRFDSEEAIQIKASDAIVGTCRQLTKNMVTGVTKGFEKRLTLNGVGYKAQVDANGRRLTLSVGYSHPVHKNMPSGISLESVSPTEFVIKGVDCQLVGQVAADIRSVRPPEPYKGKGVRYSDEVVVIKETKKK